MLPSSMSFDPQAPTQACAVPQSRWIESGEFASPLQKRSTCGANASASARCSAFAAARRATASAACARIREMSTFTSRPLSSQSSAHHDAVDAGAVFAEHELRDNVVGRHVVQGREIDEDKVCEVAFLDAADLLESQSPGAALGRRIQGFARADPLRDRMVLDPRQI